MVKAMYELLQKYRQAKAGGAALALLLAAVPAHADRYRDHDREPQENIRVSETSRMSWGMVAIPASGEKYIEISPVNQMMHGTATMMFGSPSRGAYRLSLAGGDRGHESDHDREQRCQAISIDISGVRTGSGSLKVDNFRGMYSSIMIEHFPSPTLPVPSEAPKGTMLYLGARATVSSTMKPGTLAPTFDINVIVN
jgi:hypothetical protein